MAIFNRQTTPQSGPRNNNRKVIILIFVAVLAVVSAFAVSRVGQSNTSKQSASATETFLGPNFEATIPKDYITGYDKPSGSIEFTFPKDSPFKNLKLRVKKYLNTLQPTSLQQIKATYTDNKTIKDITTGGQTTQGFSVDNGKELVSYLVNGSAVWRISVVYEKSNASVAKLMDMATSTFKADTPKNYRLKQN